VKRGGGSLRRPSPGHRDRRGPGALTTGAREVNGIGPAYTDGLDAQDEAGRPGKRVAGGGCSDDAAYFEIGGLKARGVGNWTAKAAGAATSAQTTVRHRPPEIGRIGSSSSSHAVGWRRPSSGTVRVTNAATGRGAPRRGERQQIRGKTRIIGGQNTPITYASRRSSSRIKARVRGGWRRMARQERPAIGRPKGRARTALAHGEGQGPRASIRR